MLSFFSSLILSVIDTCFYLYAVDKERNTVSRPELHAVFKAMPKPVGALVAQPDGELGYAPAGPQQAPQQAPVPRA